MQRIAIFAALQWECRPVLRHLRRVTRERLEHATVWRGTTAGAEVCLVKTGMGLERAAVAARAIGASPRFDLMMSTGCAGALAPALLPGDLAVAEAIVGNDGVCFATDAAHRARLCHAAEHAALRHTAGSVLSSPRVLATLLEKRAAAAGGSIAVEMEGASIAASAAHAGVPFVSVRAILDAAGTELQHNGRFVDPHGGAVKPLALAMHLARHPLAVPDLFAMRHMMNAAQTSLETFFGTWFALFSSDLPDGRHSPADRDRTRCI